jgi:hypothetical protein
MITAFETGKDEGKARQAMSVEGEIIFETSGPLPVYKVRSRG